ncbi:MAG: ORF6N domain-containing protein [Candidatus Omnitrophica bacterium]|nr:ORF6N domain-containing protein [Candidatus Omnitrophota bacterium]
MPNLIPQERIENKILVIRRIKVMLGQDLAKLYGVEPRALMQAVKRNKERFPKDFMFQLTRQELTNLKSQFVISSWGGIRTPPYAFTEQGVAMLSSVLNSKRAIQVNIQIMRAFIKIKEMALSYSALHKKIDAMESKYDKQFKVVFDAIRQLLEPPHKSAKRILGFRGKEG